MRNDCVADEIVDFLLKVGLIANNQNVRFEALTGGVSSDIWKVETKDTVFCVKRALGTLKVKSLWQAPLERNRYEVAWLTVANQVRPGVAPKVLAADDQSMIFAMAYFEPGIHRLWKKELLSGHVVSREAHRVGNCLAQIHGATALTRHGKDSQDTEGPHRVKTLFPREDIFHAIRLEPYLEATALKHPDLESRLFSLSRNTAATRICMIHGDVSPKNILIGPDGPVFLDAECACLGDPAFDLAFCLNHLLLKCLAVPGLRSALVDAFKAMQNAYLAFVDWEEEKTLMMRTARLLPGLLLARIDGKSPVEYIVDDNDKNIVRKFARHFLFEEPNDLTTIADTWEQTLNNV